MNNTIKKINRIAYLVLAMGILSPSLAHEETYQNSFEASSTRESYGTFSSHNTENDVTEFTLSLNADKNIQLQRTWSDRFTSCIRRLKYPKVLGGVTLVTGLALMGAAIYWGFTDYDPTVAQQFLNVRSLDTHLDFNPDESLWWDLIPDHIPYNSAYHTCLNYPMIFMEKSNYANDFDHGSGYEFFNSSGNGHFHHGNLTQMLDFIIDRCGCDITPLKEFVWNIYDNHTKRDPSILECQPNSDGQSTCCYTAWGNKTAEHWYPAFGNLMVNVINGSAALAQTVEQTRWALKIGLTGSFGFATAIAGGIIAIPAWINRHRPSLGRFV